MSDLDAWFGSAVGDGLLGHSQRKTLHEGERQRLESRQWLGLGLGRQDRSFAEQSLLGQVQSHQLGLFQLFAL